MRKRVIKSKMRRRMGHAVLIIGNLKRIVHLWDLNVDWRMILKLILNKNVLSV
jgi:hypothetical protein